jgi:glutaryl-CoA dehydrogenase
MSQLAEKATEKPALSLKDSDFVWEDPLGLENELSEDERMVRDSTRGFAQDTLMPRVIEAWREEKYDPCPFRKRYPAGLFSDSRISACL